MNNRRSTLQPMTASQGNSRPSLAGGKPSVGRLSFAPRPSLARNSISKERQSLAGGDRRKSDPRRSSAFGAGRRAETRPIGDKAYTQECTKRLIQFLTENKYDKPISPKLLQAPSAKDFQFISSFILTRLDPNLVFKNFEEEFRDYLKVLGYPFPISKSSLHVAGTPHTWPSLLGVLMWLIDLIQLGDDVEDTKSDVKDDDPDKHFVVYCQHSYRKFMAGTTEEDLDADLRQWGQQREQMVLTKLAESQKKQEQLKMEIESLGDAKSEIQELQTKRAQYLLDQEKFVKLFESLENHKKDEAKKLQDRRSGAQQLQESLDAAVKEKDSLTKTLSTQEISAFEVQKMGHEKSLLDTSLQTLGEQKENTQREIWEMEVSMCKVQDTVEKKITEYNQTAVQLQLIPATAKNANGVMFEAKLNAAVNNPKELVNVDLKNSCKVALNTLRSNLLEKSRSCQLECKELNAKLAQTAEQRQEEEERREVAEAKVRKLEDVFKRDKETANKELAGICQQVESLELEVNRIKSGDTTALAISEKTLQQLKDEQARLEESSEVQRITMADEISTTVTTVIEHIERVNYRLQTLQERAKQAKRQIKESVAVP